MVDGRGERRSEQRVDEGAGQGERGLIWRNRNRNVREGVEDESGTLGT